MAQLMKCFDFFGHPNAENQSWVCLNGSKLPEKCFFLYYNQFNRRLNDCAYGEAALTYFLLICCIPANVANFISFKRRNVKPEFLFLLAVYSACNVLIGLHGAVAGTFRLFDNWIFGDFVCVASFHSSMMLMTMSMWTMTMISYERKICVCHWMNSQNPNRSRMRRIVTMVAILAAVNIAIYIYPFFVLKVVKVLQLPIGSSTHRVCSLFIRTSYRFLVDIVYFFITFFLPLLLNIYNYFVIWLYVRKSSRNSLLDKTVLRQNKRREISLAFVSGLTHALFGVCTLPLHMTTFYIVVYDRYNARHSQSAFYFAASLLIMLRTVLSPLLMAFVRPGAASDKCNNTNSNSDNGQKKMSSTSIMANQRDSCISLTADQNNNSIAMTSKQLLLLHHVELSIRNSAADANNNNNNNNEADNNKSNLQ